MLKNRVMGIIREGGMAIGTYSGCFKGAPIIELIGHAGFDAVFIDMEHAAMDLGDVGLQVLAAERVGITPIVRPPGFDPALILQLLDTGAQGISIPHISDAAAAKAAVDAVRYPPLGDRGMLASCRAADYGKVPLQEHIDQSNREVLLAVMIEDLKALDEIDAIAATEGVDIVAVGALDLSRALGVTGQSDHPKLVAAIERISLAVKKSGNARLSLSVGHPQYPRSAAELRAMGVGYANCAPPPEVRLRRSMSQQVAALRSEFV